MRITQDNVYLNDCEIGINDEYYGVFSQAKTQNVRVFQKIQSHKASFHEKNEHSFS